MLPRARGSGSDHHGLDLAYDHMLKWILADPKRLAAFNASVAPVMGPKWSVLVKARDDFEEFKEAKVLDVCKHASLFFREH